MGGKHGLIEFSNSPILNLPAHAGMSRKSVEALLRNDGGARNLARKVINNNSNNWECYVEGLFVEVSSFCKTTHIVCLERSRVL